MKRKIVDTQYKFFSVFDSDTGSYFRTGVLDETEKTGDPSPVSPEGVKGAVAVAGVIDEFTEKYCK